MIGRQELRKVVLKEVIIEDMNPMEAIERAHRLSDSCQRFLDKVGRKRQSYWKYCLYGYNKSDIIALGNQINELVDYVSNSHSQMVISKLMDYPVLRNLWVYRPAPSVKWGYVLAALFPIGLLLYWIVHGNNDCCGMKWKLSFTRMKSCVYSWRKRRAIELKKIKLYRYE